MLKNTKGFQFCHFCYCILFPKYAIMLLVKSKIMHSCRLLPKSGWEQRKNSNSYRHFPAAKGSLVVWENAGRSDSVPSGGSAAAKHKER